MLSMQSCLDTQTGPRGPLPKSADGPGCTGTRMPQGAPSLLSSSPGTPGSPTLGSPWSQGQPLPCCAGLWYFMSSPPTECGLAVPCSCLAGVLAQPRCVTGRLCKCIPSFPGKRLHHRPGSVCRGHASSWGVGEVQAHPSITHWPTMLSTASVGTSPDCLLDKPSGCQHRGAQFENLLPSGIGNQVDPAALASLQGGLQQQVQGLYPQLRKPRQQMSGFQYRDLTFPPDGASDSHWGT